MLVNFAQRAHNQNYETDYIIRSLLDTDMYKLLMLQFIWKNYRNVQVRFSLINRSKKILLGDIIEESELVNQLQSVQSLRLRKSERIWLQGNSFYGVKNIFDPEFLDWLEVCKLSKYKLWKENSQWLLDFEGTWPEVTLWEIYSLAIIAELRTRKSLKNMSETELDIMYSRAKSNLWDKFDSLRKIPEIRFADFGTRRRHSFLWHDYVVGTTAAELGKSFTGTSNVYLAFKHDLEAIGTNAHELPMTLAALSKTDAELAYSQYKVLEQWQETYGGALLVMLPDTFGTTQFLTNAPDWVSNWTGMRIDSKNPIVAGDEYINWLKLRGIDPTKKLILPSDGLDCHDIIKLHNYFYGRIKIGFGWGTLLTNDFRNCHPRGSDILNPMSLVCKVSAVMVNDEWKPCVKMSDNYTKATSTDFFEVHRYRVLFGTKGLENAPVYV